MTPVTLRLTGVEADALHGVLSLVLNDPDWIYDSPGEHRATARASDKLVRAIKAAKADTPLSIRLSRALAGLCPNCGSTDQHFWRLDDKSADYSCEAKP